MALRAFLLSVKDASGDLSEQSKIHLVMGNESCDLDSNISAIVYSYFLQSTSIETGTLYLPLINTQRSTFRLRLESVFFLGKHGISADDLIFVSDIDLNTLTEDSSLTLTVTLVDHHELGESEECLHDYITEVIDHRPLAAVLPEHWLCEIEAVGSCCSLVANRLLACPTFDWDPTLAELLLGTILSDTGNMSVNDGIGTQTDQDVLDKLKPMIDPNSSPTAIYEEIRQSKFDLSSLTVLEMLQKDLKVLKGTHITVAMSSVGMDLQAILSSPEFNLDASEFLLSTQSNVIIIMTMLVGDGGISSRSTAVYSPDRVYREQICDVLLRACTPSLDLQPLHSTYGAENVSAFTQGNLRASRKAVLPLIRDFLAGEAGSPEHHHPPPQDDNNQNIGQATASWSLDRERREDEMRRNVNLVKTYQSHQFRTSQDVFDLAAVGTNAVISPSLSSDSNLSDVREQQETLSSPEQVSGTVTQDSDTPNQESELIENFLINVDSEIDTVLLNNNNSIAWKHGVVTDVRTDEDVLEHHSADDLLCGTHSPRVHGSSLTSGTSSGHGSKVPSYPDTPPNSYMGPTGAVFIKETHLPSFNNVEMIERIREKKMVMGDVSPGVPPNSYASGQLSPDLSFPKMTSSDIIETVNAKRQQLDWAVNSTEVGSGGNSVIYTPQNSYVEGVGIESFARENLPSFNSAEMVARIKSKQAAMLSTGLASRSSQGSEDSGCRSPDVRGSRGTSLDSPLQAYTPHNSYRDIAGLMDLRNKLPDLNEVAERLTVEKTGTTDRRSGSNSDCSSRNEELGPPVLLNFPLLRGGRHSSSQSDSQNTMSDVESLVSISTDLGTPSDNIVAGGIANLLRKDDLCRKDTGDSDVFSPGLPAIHLKPDRPKTAGVSESKNPEGIENEFSFEMSENKGSEVKVELKESSDSSSKGNIFTMLEDGHETDIQFLTAAQNIVAESIAAAIEMSLTDPQSLGAVSSDFGGGDKDDDKERKRRQYRDYNDMDDNEKEKSENEKNKSVKIRKQSVKFSDPSDNLRDENEEIVNCNENDNITDRSFEKDNDDILENLTDEDLIIKTSEQIVAKSIADAVVKFQLEQDDKVVNLKTERNNGVVGFQLPREKESLSQDALGELAFELASELIHDVLEDFPSPLDGLDDARKSAGTSPDEGVEDLSSISDRRTNFDNIVKVTTDDYSEMSTEGYNQLTIDNLGYNDDPSRDDMDNVSTEALDGSVCDLLRDTDLESIRGDSEQEDLESRRTSTSGSTEFICDKPRQQTVTMTILEDEVVSSFPERSLSREASPISHEEGLEIISSFPGRKFSKSEDFPLRRFSRDESSSRRSSQLEDSLSEGVPWPDGVETDYLPNMDPLQGSLDIVGNDAKITDVDREVVEGESFRKASRQEFIRPKISNMEETNRLQVELDRDQPTKDVKQPVSALPSALVKDRNSVKKKKIRVSFSENCEEEEEGDKGGMDPEVRPHLRSPPPEYLDSPDVLDALESHVIGAFNDPNKSRHGNQTQNSEMSEVKKNNPEVKQNNPEVKKNNPDAKENNPKVTENNPEVRENNPELKENNPEVRDNNPEVKRQVFMTTAGRISIAGEEDPSIDPKQGFTTSENLTFDPLASHNQVSELIAHTESAITKIDQELEILDKKTDFLSNVRDEKRDFPLLNSPFPDFSPNFPEKVGFCFDVGRSGAYPSLHEIAATKSFSNLARDNPSSVDNKVFISPSIISDNFSQFSFDDPFKYTDFDKNDSKIYDNSVENRKNTEKFVNENLSNEILSIEKINSNSSIDNRSFPDTFVVSPACLSSSPDRVGPNIDANGGGMCCNSVDVDSFVFKPDCVSSTNHALNIVENISDATLDYSFSLNEKQSQTMEKQLEEQNVSGSTD